MHNRWSNDELKIIKENYTNLSDLEIHELIPNHSVQSIAVKRRKLGLTKENKYYSFKDVVDILSSLGYKVLSDECEYKNMQSKIRYESETYGNGEMTLAHIFRRHNYNSRPVKRKKNDTKYRYATEQEIINALKQISPNIHITSDIKYLKDYVKYKCVKHNYTGYQKLENLLTGRGCRECGVEKMSRSTSLTKDEFQNKVSSINNNITVLEYTGQRKGFHRYRCDRCESEWEGAFTYNLSCGRCDKVKSKGEEKIRQILQKYNINFVCEKRFEDCKFVRRLPFDFYLPDYNTIIEYHGEQHYRSVARFGGKEAFIARQNHDKKKKDYCLSNGYNFVEIPYTSFNDIELIIKNIIFANKQS